MPPLALALAALVLGTGASLVWQYKLHLDYIINREITETPHLLRAILEKQALVMETELRAIARSKTTRQALKDRDRDRLLTDHRELFELLRQESGLTHLYFHAPDRENLVRLHLPENRGGRVERHTYREAERTGRLASGIELGAMGIFTLRVVQPLFEDEKLIGLVELGREIDDILQRLHTPRRLELALAIRKDLLDRQSWEQGMRMLGREADWDFLPQRALVYSSLAPFPRLLGSLATDVAPRPTPAHFDYKSDAATWRVAQLPSTDASGAVVGDLIVMYDITEQHITFRRLLAVTFAGMVIVLSSLLGFFYLVLTRTDRSIKAREQKLTASEERYRLLFQNMNSGFALHELILDEDGKPCDYRFLDINPAFEKLTGLKAEKVLGRRVLEVLPETEPYWIETYGRVTLTGEPAHFQNYSKEVGKFCEVAAYTPEPGRFAVIVTDVTPQKEAEKERHRLEEQLRQAQKLEAIGRLAGGVAHDFNNKLQTILGYTDLALDVVNPDEQLHKDLKEVRTAAVQSADLTRQLLAFARRQTIVPQVLDLNETITSMLKMLKRLLGEDIELLWQPGANLWPVKIDPAQIDQILANLTLNSRDAIIDAGQLTIETANVDIDEDYFGANSEIPPGQYVMLTISDNGVGMEREMLEKIFDPFFTTKPLDKGTGLGLATVYGIVKQNEGFINVYSEPGQGTIFRIYLPRNLEKIAPEEEPQRRQIPTGTETVLLVEDEVALLNMAKMLLEKLGYRVFAAATAGEALRLAEEHQGEIELLVTDVIMPEMNGRDLYLQLSRSHPTLKCLYMSGYSANIISHHGALDQDIHFLQKPFPREDLAVKVREALDDQHPACTSKKS
ncbi:ATP-binding protein [Desulfurivibrio alkaliphilus]|uniref:histidine kinase n=1 Tax=Desulfurivibrio alkaliphilus (strain DSM 19089 / UNIQEM U267 / AHT2) TaxID=589865 RepID=D6Z2C0_DESAT|nr:ATP-binding protein [Desulfurivibrio alkaliphilus]ADH85695.1 multi-sensor hybrid histidine kinase [Desulfurivibrio alkaliphilus AHT 2]